MSLTTDDPLTELQKHLKQISTLMYTSVGVLQRDAPSQGHKPEFLQMQHQLACDMVASVKAFNTILEHDLPVMFEGYDPADASNWPSTEKIREILESEMGQLQKQIDEKKARAARLQEFYDKITSKTLSG